MVRVLGLMVAVGNDTVMLVVVDMMVAEGFAMCDWSSGCGIFWLVCSVLRCVRCVVCCVC
jgi:hypothetical protein